MFGLLVPLVPFALACVLLAMSAGQSLTAQMAQHCYLCGLSGMAFYFSLEYVAQQRAQAQAKAASRSAERRLARGLQTENAAAVPHRDAPSQEHTSGDIESAMDSTADLAAYVGLQTQPTLSV